MGHKKSHQGDKGGCVSTELLDSMYHLQYIERLGRCFVLNNQIQWKSSDIPKSHTL